MFPVRAPDLAAVRDRAHRPVFDVDANAGTCDRSARSVRHCAAKTEHDTVIGSARNTPVIRNVAETALDEHTEFLTRYAPGRVVGDGSIVP